MLFSLLFHEFGHVAACHKFKAQHQGIGIGFYLVFPIAYSDITDVWILPKKERQIVNLAGVFMEMQYSFLIGVVALFISSDILLQTSGLLFIISLMSLNPLIRHDGYWVLSDWLNTPNLMSASLSSLQKNHRIYFQAKNENIYNKETIVVKPIRST